MNIEKPAEVSAHSTTAMPIPEKPATSRPPVVHSSTRWR